MTSQPLTHYAPWDTPDADRAVCGHRMTAADRHMTQPTCAACVAALAAEDALDAAIADTPLPLDADEAACALDPLLNAGLPAEEDGDDEAADRDPATAAAIAALVQQRATLIARYEAAYDRWLDRAGAKPSRARFEDACEELEAQIADLEAPSARPAPSPLSADLFTYAVSLNRVYAAVLARRIA